MPIDSCLVHWPPSISSVHVYLIAQSGPELRKDHPLKTLAVAFPCRLVNGCVPRLIDEREVDTSIQEPLARLDLHRIKQLSYQ